MFEGDVLLRNTDDGGNINFVNGQPDMTAGFDTWVYLSLFGGNYEDDGRVGNRKTWWGNIDEEDNSRKYISRFQNLSRSIPLTSGNLRRLEQAALADLESFKTEKAAEKILVEAAIPALNKLSLNIDIISPSGDISNFKFLINWQSYIL